MKFSALVFLSFLSNELFQAQAMPTAENLAKLVGTNGHAEIKRCPYAEIQDQVDDKLAKRLLFDPLTTPIDVSGDHEFKAPDFAAGDQRGPCPGLNALANHGYIPRNGVTGFAETIVAINTVYGMGTALSTVLAVMGTVWVGNPLSLDPGFSIKGVTPESQNILGNVLGLVGEPQGLLGSHNWIEADSSNTRDDLYVTGDAYTMNMTKFMEWYQMSDSNYTMDMMAERAALRYKQTVGENPYFYYGPVTGWIARNAGYLFPGRLFRNHSMENPGGVLTPQTLKSFFGVYGEEGSLTYRQGHEQIPQNWYRTPMDYDLVQLNLDLIDWTIKYPELANIGGNTGTVNSFTGVDLGNLTGGVYNTQNLLQGNNLLCLALQAIKFISPDAISPLYSTLQAPIELIAKAVETPLLDLSCPALKDLELGGKPYWDAIKDLFPGAKKSGGAF